MSDIIPAALRAQMTQAMEDVFDSFKRSEQVVGYKDTANNIVIKDPNFIAGFQESRQETTSIIKTAQSFSFDARIWYMDFQPLKGFVQGDGNIMTKFSHSWSSVKIQVREEGFNFLKDAERIYLYDDRYSFDEDWRRLGILGDIQFYQTILKRSN